MKKIKLLPKKVVERFLQKNPHWSINEGHTILTAEFAVSDYIAGLILMSKIIVIAHVADMVPTYTLRKDKVQIKITATAKMLINKSEFVFAEKISTLFLSTKESRRRQ